MADLTRRSLLTGCAGGAALALAACGTATTDGDGIPDLQTLRLTVDGGFTTAAIAFRTLPELTLTADGQVLTPDPVPEIYPGPLLPHLSTRDLDPAGRAALAEVVLAGGLITTPPPDFGTPGVADAPTTTLRVTLDGAETTLAANALAEAGAAPELTGEQQSARDAFRALVDRLRDLEGAVGTEHLGEPSPYAPEGVWLRAVPAPTEGVPEDPAPTVLPWPVPDVALADLDSPTLVDGEAAQSVLSALEGATELTWFRDPGADPGTDPGAEVYLVLARPALPGDPDDAGR